MEQSLEEQTLHSVLAALCCPGRSERGLPAAAHHDVPSPVTQLQHTRVLLQTLLDQLPEGIAVAYGPPDFPIVATSRRLEELTGLSRRDLLAMVATPAVDDRRCFPNDGISSPGTDQLPLHRASRLGETIRNQELVVRRPDGTRIDVLVDADPIRTPAGRIVGAITCWRDVTDMKQTQHALRMVEAQLRDADLRKDEFIGILAHELRGPLSPIRHAAHVLKLMAAGEPRLHHVGDILDRQVMAMTRLLDDLLDLSRVTRGKLALNVEPVEIGSVINQAVEWNRAVIDSKRHHLVVTQQRKPLLVNGDPLRLVQVVSNLLGNAAKFTDAEGYIWITAETADDQLIVRVRDTGPGLDASELNNVFDLFYQLERTADRSGRGLGIGLSLVRRLVEMHGGRVEALSEGLACGSEFVFRLPLLSPAHASWQTSRADSDKTRASVLDRAVEATFPPTDPLLVTQPGGSRQPPDATVERDAPAG
jgi:PAS domain S-box-containing protein